MHFVLWIFSQLKSNHLFFRLCWYSKNQYLKIDSKKWVLMHVLFLARKTTKNMTINWQDNIWTYQLIEKKHLKLQVFIQIFLWFAFYHIVYVLLYKILKLFYIAFFWNTHHHSVFIKTSFLFLLHWKILNTNSSPNELYFVYWFQFSQIVLSINTSNHCATTRNERGFLKNFFQTKALSRQDKWMYLHF